MQKFFLLLGIALLLSVGAQAQSCPPDSRSDLNLTTATSSYQTQTLNTGDASRFPVLQGAVYEFDLTSNPFQTDELGVFQKIADGIYNSKFTSRADQSSWQSDFEGDYWFSIKDVDGVNIPPFGTINYDCGWNPSSAVIKYRQKVGTITVSNHPSNASANCGESVNFSVAGKINGQSNASWSYQWQNSTDNINWSNINGETGSSYSISSVNASQFDSYVRCIIAVGVDSKTTNSAQITQRQTDPPSGIVATQDRCDSKIDISWDWYQPNPSKFKIEYSLNNSTWTALPDLSGAKRKYQHTGITRGQKYYYRISSYNDACGTYGSPSDVEWGISPVDPNPPLNSAVSEVAIDGGKGIEITWTDNSADETGFIIARTNNDGTNLVEFEYLSTEAEVTATGVSRKYVDKKIENCQPYTYRVYSFNPCNKDGVLAEDNSGNQLSHDIIVETTIYDVIFPSALETSKGYYSNKISLKWRVNTNSNFSFADRFKIYARELGANVVPELISIVDSDIRQFDDETSDAGKLYEYFIIASGDCGDGEIVSYDINAITSLTSLPDQLAGLGVGYNIGFRSPSGTINGNITYKGGIAVPDVKVVVEREEGNSGTAIKFDGVNDYIEIANTSYLEFDNAISASVWLKPDQVAAGERTILDKSGTLRLAQDGEKLRIVIGTVDELIDTVFDANQYKNITVTYDESVLNLYVNGKIFFTKNVSFNLTKTTDKLYLGSNTSKTNFFSGLIDEVRLHGQVLTSDEVLKGFGRLLKPNYSGMNAYWRFNESVGPFVFDLSNTGGVYHQNDGRIYGAVWSNDIPDGKQLGMAGYTDKNGNYSVSGVSYTGTGENFTVTPKITLGGAVHEFTPAQKVLFVGEGSSVQNEIDFTDVSSFRVTGYVRYKYNGNTEVGSEGVKFLIDGETYVQNSTGFVETDENGFFEIEVPIGHHFIQAQKAFHEFENDGKWPVGSPTYDFQDVVSGIIYPDITTRKVIGRVVGGLAEGNKKVGFGLSENNIGRATFKLKESSGENLEATVLTDPTTGEFEVSVPPMRYVVYNPNKTDGSGLQRGIDVSSNTPATIYFEQASLADDMTIDLRNTDALKYEIDSTEVSSGTWDIDSVSYHSKNLFVYRSKPQVDVYDGANKKADDVFDGENYFAYTNKDASIDSINLQSFFTDPVLIQAKDYQLRIEVSELYERLDVIPTQKDTVPVSNASIEIFNYWGKGYYFNGDDRGFYNLISDAPGVLEPIQLNDLDGDTTYTFKTASPEFNNNLSFADQSFTKTFQVTVKTKGNDPVYWPVINDPLVVKRAVIFGAVPIDGTSFVTQGPDMVDFILRDPPGDGSFATLEKGTEFSKTKSWSNGGGFDINLDLAVGFSMTTWVGFGAGTINAVSSDRNIGLDISYGFNESGEFTENYTTTQTFQTAADYVGPDFDLFVGKSENVRFGISQTLKLIPVGDCGLTGVNCVGGDIIAKDGSVYKLGSTFQSFMQPTGEITLFAYTAWHIKNTLIPNIKMLRDNVMTNNANYVSKLAGGTANYGKNNDDAVFGASVSTATPLITEPDDFTGPSYVFTPDSNDEIDSIRWFNQQIRLWEAQLAANEKEKVELTTINMPNNNISYSGGSELSFSEGYSEVDGNSYFHEFSESLSYGSSTDMKAFGVQLELNYKFAGNASQGFGGSETTTNSTTWSYTIKDDEISDYFNVKVYKSKKGNGPVFQIADGGVTQCPHEDAVYTQYYQPGTLVSARTFQQDKPRIAAEVPVLYNIPADESGNFILTLYNDSENKQAMYYDISILEDTNPNGLKLQIDGNGLGSGQDARFLIPGGTAVQKILEVEKGPFEYDYKDVKIVLSSSCQYDPTGFYKLIADTIAVSAFFLPQCTTPEILTPKDNWVANNYLKDTLTVLIGGFNINYAGFVSVNLEYKESSQSTWSLLETFYRDTTGLHDPKARQIPRNNPVVEYDWILTDVNDGEYDLRAVTKCNVAATGSVVFGESEIFSGLIDRVNPHPFGAPQPSDGILSSGEEIMIQFNEEINSGLLRPTNFSISGVLNGGDIRHSASMRFEGDQNHYMEIPYGVDLKRKSFSIDFYLAREATGEQIIVSQGFTDGDALEIGFRADNRVYFRLGNKTEVSQVAITDDIWRHYAFVYDHENGTGSITLNGSTDADDINNDFSVDFTEEGQIYIGQAKYDKTIPLNAKVHEFRIWNKALSESKIGIIATKRLERNEFGLIGNWRMEEGEGEEAKDHIRYRNAKIHGNWAMEPVGFAYELIGDAYLTAPSIAFTKENDFTLEFWFKRGASTDSVTLLSNGLGDGRDPNAAGWAIGTDKNGLLIIANNGDKLVASDESVLDNEWHHLAIAVNRITNTNVYLDGTEISSYDAENWIGFGGSKIWIGCRGWYNGAIETRDQYFNGSFDDIRIWSRAKNGDQVSLQKGFKLKGDEKGLAAYYPFETFVDNSGVLVKSSTLKDSKQGAKASEILTAFGSATAIENTPAINLPRPTRAVNFNYTANGDKIILSPIDPDSLLEGVILDISVTGVRDLNGNSMSNPVGWTAYYNKNAVLWENEELDFDISLGETLEFQTLISNVGGSVEKYRITNIPSWLTVSPSSGTLNPLSSQKITFTVDEGINIGDYAQDIYLTSDYGYEERMMINLSVSVDPPSTWAVDESDFEYSMGLVGKVKINGKFSQDANDMVAAFVNNECRGVVKLKYQSLYDQYFAYLNIYSNKVTGENVELRVWDASDGIVYSQVDPSVVFVADSVMGNSSNPTIIETTGQVQVSYDFVEGWQWVSFNVQSSKMSSVNNFMADFPSSSGDIIKYQGGFEQYDPSNGWLGVISSGGGLTTNNMYKFKVKQSGHIEFSGTQVDPETKDVAVGKGWNWISFLSQRSLDINTAMANYPAVVGDQIKSQFGFAVYESSMIGWVGSLTQMKAGEGFMLKAAQSSSFKYPSVPLNSRLSDSEFADLTEYLKGIYPERYQSNMTIIAQSAVKLDVDNVISIYNDQVKVGYGLVRNINESQYLFLTIYGNVDGDVLSIEDQNGYQFLPVDFSELKFKADQTLGTINDPMMIMSPDLQILSTDQLSIGVYPNPVDNFLNISYGDKTQLNYELVDINGRLILSGKVKVTSTKDGIINTSILKGGIYFLRLIDQNRELSIHKIIKN